jgi:3-oxoacyl-[acyl-carrier protein] reductase
MESEIIRKIVWVTGSGRGIGKEIAKHFAEIGCRVVLTSRTLNELIKMQKEILSLGGEAHVFKCDISNEKDVKIVYKKIFKKLGAVDVLVNNAGITSFKKFESTSVKEFNSVIDVNLRGPFLCTSEVLPNMIKQRDGWIFNIGSVVAIKTFKKSAAYTAAKAGLIAMGNVLREEVRNYNIKVVNILPGATATSMWNNESLKKFSKDMINPRNIAEAVVSIYRQGKHSVIEQAVIRHISGDLE